MLIKYENIQRILEPSCGMGAFLTELCDTYPEKEIYAYDIDEKAITHCREKFKTIRSEIVDFTTLKCERKFDVIIGNPPYIRYQNLSIDERRRLSNEYPNILTGNFDLYMYFIIKSLSLISENGVVIFIVPKSWWISKSGLKLKSVLVNDNYIVSITDLSHQKIFSDADTYTMILELSKRNHQEKGKSKIIWRNGMKGVPIEKCIDTSSDRREILSVNNGIATLCDNVFFIKSKEILRMDDKFIEFVKLDEKSVKHNFKIERGCTRDILKVSRNAVETIIYPYKQDTKPYTEMEMEINFPQCWTYLLSRKSQLLKRDSGRINRDGWYTYGRRQGLRPSNQTRLFISSLCPAPFSDYVIEKKASLFYSGLVITKCSQSPFSLNSVKKILDEYEDVIKENSSVKAKGWYSLSRSSFLINYE